MGALPRVALADPLTPANLRSAFSAFCCGVFVQMGSALGPMLSFRPSLPDLICVRQSDPQLKLAGYSQLFLRNKDAHSGICTKNEMRPAGPPDRLI
jgi:hypothetical protein